VIKFENYLQAGFSVFAGKIILRIENAIMAEKYPQLSFLNPITQ
jgi:hypothetical protein